MVAREILLLLLNNLTQRKTAMKLSNCCSCLTSLLFKKQPDEKSLSSQDSITTKSTRPATMALQELGEAFSAASPLPTAVPVRREEKTKSSYLNLRVDTRAKEVITTSSTKGSARPTTPPPPRVKTTLAIDPTAANASFSSLSRVMGDQVIIEILPSDDSGSGSESEVELRKTRPDSAGSNSSGSDGFVSVDITQIEADTKQ